MKTLHAIKTIRLLALGLPLAFTPDLHAAASPLDQPGWHLVAHMSGSGGMFNGNGELAPNYAFGTFDSNPLASTPDFERAFPVVARQILFITGDRTIWAVADYGALRSLIDAYGGAFHPNLNFVIGVNGVISCTTGNVLSRSGTPEDPWISMEGGHFDGINNQRIVWGETDWASNFGHIALKNTHGGINVYISQTVIVQETTPPVITFCPEAVVVACGTDLSDLNITGQATATDNCDAAPVVSYSDGTDSPVGSCAKIWLRTWTATDAAGNSSTREQYIVVYDPTAGFVTGGGWITSPARAFHPGLAQFEGVTGKATFGFVSKYQKGATVPTGNTEFQFKAGNLNFSSTSYDWLVVAGAKAQYKGAGTINGVGSYRFMLTAIDGQVSGGGGMDRFRIRIWIDGGEILYDNNNSAGEYDDPSTALGGGNIVIHK